jgi:solute:Na+ symporter, SSS family
MFSLIDWLVVGLYLVGTTVLGHRLRGPQANTRDFFLGNRDVPWQAVTASSVATTISAVTFISVPALVYADGGNLVYLQFAVAGIISRIIVAYWLLPRYYQDLYFSPYDYASKSLGSWAGRFASMLFLVGGVLGQGVRVYATALVLELLTGWALSQSIMLIGLFSILWTWMGGIRTVIWTDVVQFFVLIGSALFVLAFILGKVDQSWSEIINLAGASGKLDLVDWSTDPRVAMTFWAALLAMPFQNVAVYGTDQLFVQRLLCCRDEKAARKAVLWSTIGEIVPMVMLAVGLVLYAFYQQYPMANEFSILVAERGDRVFPVFIISELPAGIRGLMIAGLLSAAISSLDSILAALSQITYKLLFSNRIKFVAAVDISRAIVLLWGLVLCLMAYAMADSRLNLIDLAFTMTTYTYGPLLGVMVMSMVGMRRGYLVIPAALVSIILVVVLNHPGLVLPSKADASPLLAWPWLFPIGTISCLLVAYSSDLIADYSDKLKAS